MKLEAVFFQNKVNRSVKSSVRWVKNQILKDNSKTLADITLDIYQKLKLIFDESGLSEINNHLTLENDIISINSNAIDFKKLPNKNMIYRFFSDLPQDLLDDDLFNHVYNSPYTFDYAPTLYNESHGYYVGIWTPSSVCHFHELRLDIENKHKKYKEIDFNNGKFIFSLPHSIMFLNEGSSGLSPESIIALKSISDFFPKKELIEAFWD